jgi:predicted transcriptional regulator
MSTTELRNKIIDKLESVDDQLLKEILSIIEFESETGIYKVNQAEREAIEQGLSQIENGDFITNEEVEKETNSWLNK